MLKRWRRKRLLNASFSPAWRQILEARVPLYARLPEADRQELEGIAHVFLAEKTFEGCGGLVITDEIKICVAAQACLLLLHRNTDYYPGLRSILVYPSSYFARTVRHLGSGIMDERKDVRLGEAWQSGAVVLAWDAVCAAPSDPEVGRNIVLHEFAHLLDFEDGHTNGAPSLDSGEPGSERKSRYASWARTLSTEFEKLRAKAQNGEEMYLDVYGVTNPAEFFAVATESFFEWPHEMKAQSPELYDELKQFYRQDPAQWTPASQKPANARASLDRGAAKQAKGDLVGALDDYNKALEIKRDYARAYFGLGSVKRAQGNLHGALADYDQGIALNPDAASAYVHRGLVKRAMRDLTGALTDFSRAIDLDPDDSHTYYNRALIEQAKGDFNGALADYDKAIELNPEYAWAYNGRGRLRYNLRRFADALVDFRKECELGTCLSYGHCRVWLVRARLGEREAATRELCAWLKNIPTGEPDDWKSNIARFLIGQLTESDFFKTAGNSEDKKDSLRSCEAWFYAGTKRLIDGEKTTATEYFEKCLAADKKDFAACQSAAAELKFLKEQVNNPSKSGCQE